jgi:hypothetical protein
MRKLIAPAPNAEVFGESVLGYVNCLQVDEIFPILSRHGLEKVDPQSWYPMQNLLDVLKEIQDEPQNVSESLVSIGMKILEIATVPPTINSIPSVLESFSVLYRMHHRNVTDNGWLYESLGLNHIQITHTSAYPADVAYGLIWGGVKRFRPANAQFSVKRISIDEIEGNEVYEVTWKLGA